MRSSSPSRSRRSGVGAGEALAAGRDPGAPTATAAPEGAPAPGPSLGRAGGGPPESGGPSDAVRLEVLPGAGLVVVPDGDVPAARRTGLDADDLAVGVQPDQVGVALHEAVDVDALVDVAQGGLGDAVAGEDV